MAAPCGVASSKLLGNVLNLFSRKLHHARARCDVSKFWRSSRFRRMLWKRNGHLAVLMMPIFTVHALERKGSQKQKDGSPADMKTAEILAEADRMYSQNIVIPLYEYLVQFKDTSNDEILWRLARATVDKGKNSADPKEKKQCMYEAYEYIKRALETGQNNFAVHKWYAILLDYTGEYEGTKQRISNAYLVKTHFVRAIELNPKDATAIHSLGFWCFVFADMPWYQQKIAAALFATPPTSTYEEALKYFHQAEEAEPNFYSTNLLMLGKTYLRMKNFKMAETYFSRTLQQPVRTPDDEKANKEAKEWLRKLGIDATKGKADQ